LWNDQSAALKKNGCCVLIPISLLSHCSPNPSLCSFHQPSALPTTKNAPPNPHEAWRSLGCGGGCVAVRERRSDVGGTSDHTCVVALGSRFAQLVKSWLGSSGNSDRSRPSFSARGSRGRRIVHDVCTVPPRRASAKQSCWLRAAVRPVGRATPDDAEKVARAASPTASFARAAGPSRRSGAMRPFAGTRMGTWGDR
jgi:hypothetical protein